MSNALCFILPVFNGLMLGPAYVYCRLMFDEHFGTANFTGYSKKNDIVDDFKRGLCCQYCVDGKFMTGTKESRLNYH